MQWDQRWGYHRYAGEVMGLSGCGPTALSMVAIFMTGDITKNPRWVADFASQNGYAVDGSGTAWSLMLEGARQIGLSSKESLWNGNGWKTTCRPETSSLP